MILNVAGKVKWNGNYFYAGEIVTGTLVDEYFINVIEYDSFGTISRQGIIECEFIEELLNDSAD